MKENCIWLTVIKCQGAREYYCDAPFHTPFECKNCSLYMTKEDIAKDFKKMKAPCLDCEERHFKCHSDCEKYIEYVKHNTKIYENRNKENTKWIIHK